jgi:hypothetical protein
MALHFAFTGPSDRERLLALGDVDQRERDAVAAAKARRAVIDLGGPDGGRFWRVVSEHTTAHSDAISAAVYARATGSTGATYNDAKVEQVSA